MFAGTDAADSWTALNIGLTDLNTRALAIDPTASGTLYVGTKAPAVSEFAPLPSVRGDCNSGGLVNVSDLTAVVLEIFDGDGANGADAPSSSHAPSART